MFIVVCYIICLVLSLCVVIVRFFECKDTTNSKFLCLDYIHNIIFNKNKTILQSINEVISSNN